MLCAFCSNLCSSTLVTAESFDARQVSYKVIYDQPGQDAHTLISGSRQGCYICSAFWSRAPLAYRSDVQNGFLRLPHYQPGVVNSYEIAYLTTPEMRKTIKIYLYYDPVKNAGVSAQSTTRPLRRARGGKRAYTQSFMLLPYSDIAPYVPTNSNLADTTAATASGRQIREWLDNCMKNHNRCKKPNQIRSKFPQRLLAVEDDIIKIQDSTNISSYEQYVALSYCWGTHPIDKLTPSSERSWYSGVHLSKLPKTYSDAIYVTRAVGMKYLWIDALCMMQEPSGNSEWKAEAGHMGDIYSNAWCTIAATHGDSSRSGCFVERSPRILEQTPYNPPRGLTYRAQQFCVVDSMLWEHAITDAPINKRGWVLQERLLAPRTVHFCAEQVFWECVETAACESFPKGLPEELKKHRRDGERIPENEFKYFLREAIREYQPIRQMSPYARGFQLDAVDPTVAYDSWNIIVAEYSHRSLTQDNDKLLAISSVAEKLKPAINDTLVAGLWKNYLPHGLSWSRDEVRQRNLGARLAANVAPTWSWASLKGDVKFLGSSKKWKPATTVVRCPAPDSAATQATNRDLTLTLQGPLQQLFVREIGWPGNRPGPWRWAIQVSDVKFPEDTVVWDDKKSEDFVGKSLYVTPLVIGWGVGAQGTDGLRGLILERYGRDKFKRVGNIRVRGQRNDPQMEVLFEANPSVFSIV